MGIRVDSSGGNLGIHDLLGGVDTVVSGEEIADGNCHEEVGGGIEAEELAADKEAGNGAVRHTAEDTCHADGGEERRIQPEEHGKSMTEGGADKEGGDDLTALKAAGERNRGEYDFQEEGAEEEPEPRILHTALDHGHSGAVIVLVTNQQGQEEDRRAGNGSSQITVSEKFGEEMLCPVNRNGKENADKGAEHREDDGDEGGADAETRNFLNRQIFCVRYQKAGEPMRRQRGNHAGYERGIVHEPDSADFHGENRGSERGTEERGKRSTHAAHDNDTAVVRVHVYQTSDSITHGAADLERCSLPSDGGTGKVGYETRKNNERCHTKRHPISLMDGVDDEIGTLGLRNAQEPIVEDDYSSGEREQTEK